MLTLPEHFTYSRNEGHGRKRLRQHWSPHEAGNPADISARDQYNGKSRVSLGQLESELMSIHPWHTHVRDHYIHWRDPLQQRQCFDAISSCIDVVSLEFHDAGEE